jgi:hypothetical protein
MNKNQGHRFSFFTLAIPILLLGWVLCGATMYSSPPSLATYPPGLSGREPVAQRSFSDLLISGTPLPSTTTYHIGDIIDDGDLLFTVLGWRLSQGAEAVTWQALTPEPNNQYLVVDIVLRNIGTQPLEFVRDPQEIELRDSHNRIYKRDGFFLPIPAINSNWVTVNPGDTVRCSLVFQVPLSSDNYGIIYTTSYLKTNNGASVLQANIQLGGDPQTVALPDALSIDMQKINQIGEAIKNGDLTMAVLGWDESTGNQYNKPITGMKYVCVDVMMVNHGSTSLTMLSYYMALRDSSLQQFTSTYGYTLDDPLRYLGFPMWDIPPGDRGRGNVCYQAPDLSKDFTFLFDNKGTTISVALGAKPVSMDPPKEMLAPNPNAHAIGEVIRRGNVSFEVLGWSYGTGANVQPEAGYVFLVVNMRMQNSGAPIDGSPRAPELRDVSGYVYSTDYNIQAEKNQLDSGDFQKALNSNMPASGKLVYEVRASAGDYALIVNPMLLGQKEGDPIIINLGSQPKEVSALSTSLAILNLPPDLVPILVVLCLVIIVATLGVILWLIIRRRKKRL